MESLRLWVRKSILVNWSGVNRMGATTCATIVQIDEASGCAIPHVWAKHELTGDVRLVLWDDYYFEWVNSHIGMVKGESEGERSFQTMLTARKHWQRCRTLWGSDHPLTLEYYGVYHERKRDVFKTPVWVKRYGEIIKDPAPMLMHPPAL